MFEGLKLDTSRPAYLQVRDYIKGLILQGMLQPGIKLPSTRELSGVLGLSRNTVIQAYHYLEDDGFIEMAPGQGAFVAKVEIKRGPAQEIPWTERLSETGRLAVDLDIEKKELKWERGMIAFKSIAPDGSLFEVEEFKKAFLNRFSIEGEKLLNYGYAKGYRPLIFYLMEYMRNKGVDLNGKDILITNGFTEGFNLVLTAVTKPGDRVVCENPTHNTAIKIMRLKGLSITGVDLRENGVDPADLEAVLSREEARIGYLIPSYHNPTGIVMSPEKRLEIMRVFERHRVPVIEDGFNEELRYSGSHVAPLIALAGRGNGIVYLGSLSKILFPGLRIGWIMADAGLINYLESLKRSWNIHSSFLDQAVLYEYLQSGQFERYLKKARKLYKERHEEAVRLAKELIPSKRIWGAGGLHIFIELERPIARQVLAESYRQGVIFMPGDIFYTDGGGQNAFRLGISRVTREEMAKGFRIIGEVVRRLDTVEKS